MPTRGITLFAKLARLGDESSGAPLPQCGNDSPHTARGSRAPSSDSLRNHEHHAGIESPSGRARSCGPRGGRRPHSRLGSAAGAGGVTAGRCSIFTTSAPMSAGYIPQVGPAIRWATSSTRYPTRGRVVIAARSSPGTVVHPCWACRGFVVLCRMACARGSAIDGAARTAHETIELGGRLVPSCRRAYT
jgi:hypothetical protein